jgi:hypothetical protein
MKIYRRKLGTVYVKSPAQIIENWTITNVSKIFFAIVYGCGWMGVFYMITGIIRFLSAELMKWEDWQAATTWEVYCDPKFVWTNMLGFVVVVVYCLRDSLTKR